jgi:signal transduction histidine kinase
MIKTLKGKISLVYIALVCLIALLGGISVYKMEMLQRSVNGLIAENYAGISAAYDAKAALINESSTTAAFVDFNAVSNGVRFSDYDRAFKAALAKEKANSQEPGEEALIGSIEKDYGQITGMFTQLSDLRDNDIKGAAGFYKSTVLPQTQKISDELNEVIQLNQNAMLEKKSSVARSTKVSIDFIIIFSLTAAVGGFFMSKFFINRFLYPIQLLTKSISRVRAGELDMKIRIKTGDETERLISEFNEMMQRLSAYEKSTLGTLMNEKNKTVAIVKSISDPLIVLDENLKIIMTNSAFESFFKIGEISAAGKAFRDVIRDDALYSYIKSSSESGDTISEKVLYFQTDKEYYFNVVVTKNLDAERNVRGCVVLMQNVTGFKELERVKTDFVATVSHEFKTPLTSIIMGASLLDGGNLGSISDEQAEVVKTIIEESERLSGFVNELLEMSKLESGMAVFSFEPCSFSAIAENSMRRFAEAAKRGSVTLENDVDEQLPLIYADFDRITWVINNLLSNALKYTKSGDRITIGAKVSGGFLKVWVKDTGDGIPPEYLERIFDKFVQVKGHDIEVRGTGLGLSVAKEIVNAHGGEIWVESEMDAGSRFYFTLPLFSDGLRQGR